MKASRGKKDKSVPVEQSLLRTIPKVDEVLHWLTGVRGVPAFLVKQSVRKELDLIRQYFVAYSRAKYALIVLGSNTQLGQGRIPCGPTRTWLRNNSIPLRR